MMIFDLFAAGAVSLVTAFAVGSIAVEIADRVGIDNEDLVGFTTCALAFAVIFWRLLAAMGVVL